MLHSFFLDFQIAIGYSLRRYCVQLVLPAAAHTEDRVSYALHSSGAVVALYVLRGSRNGTCKTVEREVSAADKMVEDSAALALCHAIVGGGEFNHPR